MRHYLDLTFVAIPEVELFLLSHKHVNALLLAVVAFRVLQILLQLLPLGEVLGTCP